MNSRPPAPPSPPENEPERFVPVPPFAGPSSSTPRLDGNVLRYVVSADALLAANQVIDLIGGRSAIVRAWLRENVPSLPHPSGRTIYRWGDVLDAMRRAA